MSTKGMRLHSFTVNEKLKFVEEAEETSNRSAACKFDVSKSCIHDWRKKKLFFLQSSGTNRAFHGQKVKFPEIEVKLVQFIEEKKQFGSAVSTEMCQIKACELAQHFNQFKFKASRGWIVRFLIAMDSLYREKLAFLND